MSTPLVPIPSAELQPLWHIAGEKENAAPLMEAEVIEARLEENRHRKRAEIAALCKKMGVPTGIGGDAIAGSLLSTVMLAATGAGILWFAKPHGMLLLIMLATLLGGGGALIFKILADDQAAKRRKLSGMLFRRQLKSVSTETLEELFAARGGIKSRYYIKSELEQRSPTPTMQEVHKRRELNHSENGMSL